MWNSKKTYQVTSTTSSGLNQPVAKFGVKAPHLADIFDTFQAISCLGVFPEDFASGSIGISGLSA